MSYSRKPGAGFYHNLAVGIGWFSAAVGLMQLIAPRKFSKVTGVSSHPRFTRFLGARNFLIGGAILTRSNPVKCVHAKVASDAMDLALLSGALCAGPKSRGRLASTLGVAAGVTALDMYCGVQLSKGKAERAIRFGRSITVNRGADELYGRWRNLEDLPDYMSHLQAVFVTGPTTSHWISKAPAGTRIEWDAELVEDRPNEYIAWRSLPGALVENSGSVTFEPATGNRGTIIRVEMEYVPPAGHLGAIAAKIFGQDPRRQIAVDLMRFKQKIETGEIARTCGQPMGRQRVIPRTRYSMAHKS